MMKKKEVIEALTAIKGYCDEHYCGDCCIRYICDNNFSGFPDDWEIPGVEDTLPVVYIKPVNGGKVPEKKTENAFYSQSLSAISGKIISCMLCLFGINSVQVLQVAI